MRSQLQRLAKRRFTLVSTVDIGVIDGGDAQIQMLFNKADQLARGHIPVHQAPVPHHKTRKFRPCGAIVIR
jgi:hypothetical protein